MGEYIVSARKYRPMSFDMVVGQSSITNTLKNAIKNNHLAQAFLFCGPRGVGKTTCARILAKTINCENISQNIEACNTCKSCVSFNEANSFNVHELDAASNNSVDDIRSLVDQVRIPPHYGKYKIYVIDEVHMLSQAAFNAFLKTLEEPPAYAKFILATTEKHKIIPTILSRCQIFDFARITENDIARQLEYVAKMEGVETEPDALQIIARKADGAMRDALSIFDQLVSFAGNNVTYKAVAENLNVLDYDYFFLMTEHLLACNPPEILLLYNQITDKGFDGSHFITGFSNHLRNLLVCKDKRTIKLIESGENIKQKYIKQSEQCTPDFLLKALDLANQSDISYRNSNNRRLHVEIMLLQIAGLTGIPAATKSGRGEPVMPPVAKPVSSQKVTPIITEPKKDDPLPPPVLPITAPTLAQTTKSGKAFSIKINKPNPEGEIKKDDASETTHLVEQGNDIISAGNLLSVWEKLTGFYKTTSVTLFTALNNRTPHIINDNTLHILVDNIIQKDALIEKRTEILSFLRKNLNNIGVNLEISVAENPQETKAYLPADKYKKMASKNPNIEILRNELDLDLNY